MLQNALETGKSCIQYCISWGSGFDAEGYLKFLNWLSLISESKCITSLLAHLKIAKYYDSPDGNESCAELEQGLKVVKIEVNARQVFSPFKLERIKPLTVIPEKPNAGHLIKLLANGQYRFLRQDYKYTDDYSFDASDDFGKKVFENPFRLLSDLIENRGKGFTVFRSADEFSFGPHSNDSKSLKPVIDNRFPSFDIPDLEKHSLT